MAENNGTGTSNEAGDRDGAEGASGADRLTQPPDDGRLPRLPFPVVGIGASAGGLEAYTEFLQACPADAGMAYVFVQHLPPDRESLMAELLTRHTVMPVREVEDGQAVEPDHVYMIRPGHTLTIKDGRLHLGPVLEARGHGRPVDDFFRSLAEEQQQRAVAVVFSGMGSNGTAGAQAVKAVGGLVIAQEPDTAKFPAMPRSLIDAHLPDFILRPSEVPEALVKYAGHPYAVADDESAVANPREEQSLADVLAVLRTRTRHDFAGYRKPTLLRRVRRRMGLGQYGSMAEYVRALRQTPAEVTALADDLLIHVTGFFRDPEAWDVLREKVIDPLAADRADGAEVRCWVSACATGEEAYTLAMLLTEAAEARGKRFDVKVFATDMAERALGAARAGLFPNGIESEVTPERLGRFFDKDDSFYRVKKELRELVIFAPQNILQDPPFSRLDIATCRNLLIYLEPETQRRVLALLHFGLREGGTLMLGTSESAAPADGDFEPIDKKHRLFRRVGPTRGGALDLPVVTAAVREGRPASVAAPVRTLAPATAQLVTRALLDRHTPAAVAVDAAGQVVYVHGDTTRYLTLAVGGPTFDLLALANDQVRGAVRTALHQAADAHLPVTVRDGLMDTTEGRRRIEVGAAPLGPRGGSPAYLVTFRDYPEGSPSPPTADGDDPSAAERLADELQRTRNELQGAMEEMQSSNEELKASHEEATSLNEELQSTNEELETSKEEMQSLNEELVTVNAQLQAKMTELEGTANDLGSLLTSTDIAVLFLDTKYRIRRFTPATRDLLDLIPSDVGRPLADLRRKFADPDLTADAQAVLDKLVPVERPVESESGRHYIRRVLPYRTQDNRIDGVVIAFVDVTDRRKVDAALRASEGRLSALVRASANAVYRMSPDWGQMLQLDGVGFLEDTPRPSESWLDRYILPDDRPAVEAAITRAVRGKGLFELEHRVVRADGSVGWTHSRAVPLLDAAGAITEWFGAAYDVTPRVRAQEALRESEKLRQIAVESGGMGTWIWDTKNDRISGDAVFMDLYGFPPTDGHFPLARFTARMGPEAAAACEAVAARELIPGEEFDGNLELAAGPTAGRWVRWRGRVDRDNPHVISGVSFDVTEAKRAEERQAFLLKLSDALRPLADPVAVEVEAVRILGEHLGVGRALYAEVEPDEDHVRIHRDYTAAGTASIAGRQKLSNFGRYWLEGYRGGRTLATADFREIDGAQAAAFEAVGVRACVGVPVNKGGRFVGVLFVHSATRREWTPAEVALVEETAERTWAAVERARAEDALRASEARLRAVAANLPSGAAFVVDTNLRYVLAGGEALSPAGLAPADLEGKTLAEVLPPALAAEHAANYRRVLAGEAFHAEHAAHGRHYATHGVPLRDAAGRVTAALAVSYDITDRKTAEEAVRRAEGRLRLALNAARMGTWTLDAATGSHTRDANLNGLLGLDPVETTQPFDEFLTHVHPADRAALDAAFAASIAEGRPLNVEFRVVRPDGAVRWLRDQGDVFGDAAAGRRHMAGACVDVTERAEAEAAVRASEERFRLLVESVPDHAIFAKTPDGRVTGWNAGAERLLGYAAAEVTGQSVGIFFTPEDRADGRPDRELAAAAATGRANQECWTVRKDGRRFWSSGVCTAMRDADGRLTGFVKVVRDLTDRKAMEDELRVARDRLEERVAERTAELAAVIDALETEVARRREMSLRLSAAQEDERQRVSRDLHDTVGQTHAGLSMALRAVADAVPPEGAQAERLAYARKLADDMGRELHEAAVRLRPTALDDIGLEAAVRDLTATWTRHTGVAADVYFNLGGRLAAEAETALYRVVQEALTNVARHARATAVSVMITRSDGTLQAVVEDNGAGFDPAAVGNRLGLVGMRERLGLLGGDLEIESAVGRGTTVIARIPESTVG